MIGTMVGSYQITEKIGEGGMGAVFRGIDVMLEREVAIKMLRPELASQPQVVERFRSEAVTLAKLNHPNIATLYSFLRQGDHFFMVMEFVKGETLDDVIRGLGAMPVERAVTLFCQALEGIEHAHKMGIIHRDIKPANMMLAEDGALKVMDFGIARVLGTARLTRQGSVVGTIEYMSPEQVRGEEGDARSDIYSLGILFYEMLTGRVPFHSTSEFALMKAQIEDPPTPPRMFAPHIPIPIEQAIMRSLAKKPEARFQSGGEFREAVLRKTGTTGSRPVQAAHVPVASQPSPSVSAQHGTVQFGTAGTRTDGTPIPAPSGEHLKETRLGSSSNLPPAFPAQANEARLPDAVPQGYATRPEHYYHTSPEKASFFARLNWKHYAGAGAALLVLLVVPFVIIAGLKRGQADAPPPAQQSSPASQQAEEQSPTPTQPQNQITPLPSQEAGVPPADPANPGSTKARPRDNNNAGAEQPPSYAETSPPPTVETTPPPVKSETSTPPKEPEKKEVAKKEEEKKEEKKKKGGIGGFFKKILGGGDEKKEEKKKKP